MSNLVLLNAAEAADYVGMTRQLFNYYLKKKRVPGIKIIGLKRFIDKSALDGWKPEDKRFGAKRK